MKVLVVGASGLIGRNTAKFLRDHGYSVRGVSRGFGEYRTASKMKADLGGVDLSFGDIADQSFAATVLHDVQWVVYAAGASGVAASIADPAASYSGIVAPCLSLFENSLPGTRIVLMSSQLVYGPSQGQPFTETDRPDPSSPYAANLALVEQEGDRWAHQRKLQVVSLRLGNVFGDIVWLNLPRSHGLVAIMLRDLITTGEIGLFGGGSQTVNLLHVGDLAAAISHVVEHRCNEPYEIFNVSGEELAVRSVAQSLCEGARTGELVSVPWPEGLERTAAGDIELDDSKFRRRFTWRRERSATRELVGLARSWAQDDPAESMRRPHLAQG